MIKNTVIIIYLTALSVMFQANAGPSAGIPAVTLNWKINSAVPTVTAELPGKSVNINFDVTNGKTDQRFNILVRKNDQTILYSNGLQANVSISCRGDALLWKCSFLNKN